MKRSILVSFLVILIIASIFLYRNYNRLISESLIKSYNSSIAADVYELKFEKLHVNFIEGSIKLVNVSLLPRERPLHDYPYINSSFRLETEMITLENVELSTLLSSSKLILNRISITKPDVGVTLTGTRHIIMPFTNSTDTVQQSTEKKKSLKSFMLNEFQLINASFHVTNAEKLREFKINNFNITLNNLLLNQQPGEYLASFSHVLLSIGASTGDFKKGPLQYAGFKDFKIGIDSLAMQFTMDTLTYQFHDFNSSVRDLDVQTADSTFHISMKSFDLSYLDKSVKLRSVSFKPNVSHSFLQKNYQYQHTEFSGSVGTVDLNLVSFDSLIYYQKIWIGEIVIDRAKASIFKDKTKLLDTNRFPKYLGQTVAEIHIPLSIKQVMATNIDLENTERKPDSTYAKVNINKATLEVKNITNLSPRSKLVINADAFINGKVHFRARLAFYYQNPAFSFEGTLEKFNLPDMNSLIQSYTPAKINKGIVDEISFSGMAEQTKATGIMKFLYHDLEIDLQLKEKAKWKSAVIAFTANTALNSSNPKSSNLPPRIVKFQMERDMNKGFVNVIIKSILNSLKETMIMSKENRQAYKESKKQTKNKKLKEE